MCFLIILDFLIKLVINWFIGLLYIFVGVLNCWIFLFFNIKRKLFSVNVFFWLCVININVIFNLDCNFCNLYCILVCNFKFNVDKDLFNNNIFGLFMIVCVIVICCFCLLFILLIFFFL